MGATISPPLSPGPFPPDGTRTVGAGSTLVPSGMAARASNGCCFGFGSIPVSTSETCTVDVRYGSTLAPQITKASSLISSETISPGREASFRLMSSPPLTCTIAPEIPSYVMSRRGELSALYVASSARFTVEDQPIPIDASFPRLTMDLKSA